MKDAGNISGKRRRDGRFAPLLTGLLVLIGLLAPSTAGALPAYEGSTSFGQISSPADPEEFSWEVTLASGQELKPIDDQHAAVYYEDGHLAFTITAAKAHDAVGATVPTSLSVSAGNVVTLTVHHRAGNPATGGAPFDYPILEGEGWEGGFSTVPIVGPPDEEQLRLERERREAEERERQEALKGCRVPTLRGWSVRAAGNRLRRGGCKLGKVRGDRSRRARVVKQDVKAGWVLPAGSTVSVKVG